MIFLPNFEEKKFARKIKGNPVIHEIACDINIQVPLTSLAIMKVNVISFFCYQVLFGQQHMSSFRVSKKFNRVFKGARPSG